MNPETNTPDPGAETGTDDPDVEIDAKNDAAREVEEVEDGDKPGVVGGIRGRMGVGVLGGTGVVVGSAVVKVLVIVVVVLAGGLTRDWDGDVIMYLSICVTRFLVFRSSWSMYTR